MRNKLKDVKKGISLLEVMVSLLILSLILASLLSICNMNYRASLLRQQKEKAARIVYCLQQEIKYNYSLEEVVANLQAGDLQLKASENFLDNLIYQDVFVMESGPDIEIRLLGENEDSAEINIKIEKSFKGLNILEEKTFIKDRYMNESY